MSHNNALCDIKLCFQAQIGADPGAYRCNFVSHNPGGHSCMGGLRAGCARRPGGVSGTPSDKSAAIPEIVLEALID